VKIEGQYRLPAPREAVWAALNDPGVLAKTTPGLKQLTPAGTDTFDALIELAVGPVKGSYQGKVRITDQSPPERMTLIVEGGGRAGTIRASGALRLEDQGDATMVHYVGDAQVTGVLMSVGHRLFGGVAKQLAGEFFKALENEVARRSAGPAR
jgi:carbon monoxide dehydrogenase subunit G